MVGTSVIVGFSVAHDRADLDAIEAACGDGTAETVASLLRRTDVSEAFALQTCNRAEAYVVAESEDEGRAALAPLVADVPVDPVEWLDHEASLRHLMRVACGLESLVVGEDQILGQLRDAYGVAKEAGGIGPVFEDAVTKALHVGERARSETAINEGAVSLGSAAVRLVDGHLDLDDATALVVGTGEMGTLTARALAEEVATLVVANRTFDHARHVAETLAGETTTSAVDLGELPAAIETADLVVTATSADEVVIDAETAANAGETFLVDLAQPRDVAPETDGVENVTVRDLDALESVTDETEERRAAAARDVEELIDAEYEHLIAQYKRKRADEVIGAMYEGAEGIKRREVATALSRMEAAGDLTDEQREAVQSLADSLVGQLLAAPTKSLRDAAERDDWSTIRTAIQLFDPSPPGAGSDVTGGSSPESIGERAREGMPQAVLEQLDD
jgi:glutamyl-tRNA reductase